MRAPHRRDAASCAFLFAAARVFYNEREKASRRRIDKGTASTRGPVAAMKAIPGQNIKMQGRLAPAPQTVVVVDDSATMRAIIQKELEVAGFSVVAFSDGLAALSSLRWMQKPTRIRGHHTYFALYISHL